MDGRSGLVVEFFLVPLLVAAGLGVLGGASARWEAKRESDSLRSGCGDAPHRDTGMSRTG